MLIKQMTPSRSRRASYLKLARFVCALDVSLCLILVQGAAEVRFHPNNTLVAAACRVCPWFFVGKSVVEIAQDSTVVFHDARLLSSKQSVRILQVCLVNAV